MRTTCEIRWPVEMDSGVRTPEEEIPRRAYEHDEVPKERIPISTDAGRRWPLEMDNETRTPEEEIRRRAYEHYEARAREDGHDVDDWNRAEAEIKRKIRAAAA